MVMFHCARRIQDRQRTIRFRLKRIVRAPMVQVVAQASHQQAQNLQIGDESFHFARFHNGEHRLGNIEAVPPIMVLEGSIVFADAENPAAQNLEMEMQY